MHFYLHNIGDFNAATRHLTRLERSIYRDLIDMYYDTEQPISLDLNHVCRKILASRDDEPAMVISVLNEFFIETGDGWVHERCEKEIAAYLEKANKAAVSANARWTRSDKKTQEECERYANAMRTHSDGNADAMLNKKQETRNKKQETNKASPVGALFSNIDPQVVSDFKAMRAKQKAAITKTSIEGIQREADKAGIGLEAALRVCCERGWRGFKADWITSPQAVKSNLGMAGQSTALAAQKFLENLSHD